MFILKISKENNGMRADVLNLDFNHPKYNKQLYDTHNCCQSKFTVTVIHKAQTCRNLSTSEIFSNLRKFYHTCVLFYINTDF